MPKKARSGKSHIASFPDGKNATAEGKDEDGLP
jgi:hypothetical protein